MGFDGKTLIHPGQIEPCNAAFSPEANDVAAAREILVAFAKPENAGPAALSRSGVRWSNGCIRRWRTGQWTIADAIAANRRTRAIMLTFFAPGTSSMAPHIALHEIGVPFEIRPLSFATEETPHARLSRDQSAKARCRRC